MSQPITIDLGEHSTELTERVRTEDGRGYTSRKVGRRVGRLTLTVDASKLPWHKVIKALTSKGHRTVTNGGLVTITASDLKDVPAAAATIESTQQMGTNPNTEVHG